jgi:hypothetical protein
MMLDEDNPVIEFSTASRCDRCGTQAHAMATHENGDSELLFCLHHFRKVYAVMVKKGWDFSFSEDAYEMLDSRPLAVVD